MRARLLRDSLARASRTRSRPDPPRLRERGGETIRRRAGERGIASREGRERSGRRLRSSGPRGQVRRGERSSIVLTLNDWQQVGGFAETTIEAGQMTPEIAQAQDALVKAVMEVPDVPWERIVVNWEILDDGGEQHMGWIAFYISRNPDRGLTETNLKNLPAGVRERLLAVRELMTRLHGDRWAGCDLAIDSDGRYEFNFSYDPPKRFNGIIDDESYWRFSRYLDDYKAGRKTLSTD